MEVIRREAVYLWYYFTLQLEQVFPYWAWGMAVGSAVSVFAKDCIHSLVQRLDSPSSLPALAISSALGIASPLCMYGTIPVAASFSRAGVSDGVLASFMMSSVLLNPQLILYSAVLGRGLLAVRILSAFLCGIAAGLLVRSFCSTGFFSIEAFDGSRSRDTDKRPAVRFVKNFGRNLCATGGFFLLGIVLSALFQRYVPDRFTASLLGRRSGPLGVLISAAMGVPLYACGGGTIPLLLAFLEDGMSSGSAAAFMITGPATKITNLGALKIAIRGWGFVAYLCFTACFALLTGIFTNIVIP